jgi:hypothetical protein
MGIDRCSRREPFTPTGHGQPCIGAHDVIEGEIADRQRHPGAITFLEQSDIRNSDA